MAVETAADDIEVCPVRRTMTLLQGKWSTWVLYSLQEEDSLRFGELRRRIGGVTKSMLSQTLKELEAKGLVSREQFNEIPPHTEYSLTEAGRAFGSVFRAMAEWGNEYLPPVGEGHGN